MVELKDVHQQPEQTEETDKKLELMDAWTVFDEWVANLGRTFPVLHQIYCQRLEPTIDACKKK